MIMEKKQMMAKNKKKQTTSMNIMKMQATKEQMINKYTIKKLIVSQI
jgi:hypothetical protein